MTTAVAIVLLVAVTAYSITGGSDFGAGFWDLVAGGAERGEHPPAIIDHSVGPVWEANHVWLIFCSVLLWTGFPEAYASIGLTAVRAVDSCRTRSCVEGIQFRVSERLPSALAIVVTSGPRSRASSVLVPYCFGGVAGAVTSGRVPSGGEAGDPWDSWVNPTSVLGGVLAVVVVAYLAAGYLVWDARAWLADEAMVDYFQHTARWARQWSRAR